MTDNFEKKVAVDGPAHRRARLEPNGAASPASVHASIHNHFSHERHLNRRDIFKQARAAALAEWRQLAA